MHFHINVIIPQLRPIQKHHMRLTCTGHAYMPTTIHVMSQTANWSKAPSSHSPPAKDLSQLHEKTDCHRYKANSHLDSTSL